MPIYSEIVTAISRSKLDGTIFVRLIYPTTDLAIAYEAATFIYKVIYLMLFSKIPLKIPGKTNELFIWFSKSLLPVATIKAPFSLASLGKIYGSGLANANIMFFLFINLIHYPFKDPPADTPIKISAPIRQSLS